MKLSKWSVKRPVGVVMIIAIVLVLSFTGLRNLSVDLYPDMELPLAVVATSYSGTAPEDIEELVTKPIEDSLVTIDSVDNVQSQSISGSSLVIIQFDFGTDLDQAMLDVREAVDGVRPTLPDGANDPSVLRFNPNQQPIMWIGLEVDESVENVQHIAEDRIQPRLEQGSGVASVIIEGIETRKIEVQLRMEDLNRYGLTAQNVIQVLQSENMSASAGEIESGNQNLQLRVEGEFEEISDIENTLIPLGNGEHIRVQDVANVVDTVEDQSSLTFVNGSPSYMFSIMKQSDANTVEVSHVVRELVEQLNDDLGEGLGLQIVFDSADFIEQSLSSVTNNLLLGAIFSVVVLLLFLRSVRATLVISISIPIALISTFSLMYFTGETLNLLTMGGLALGVGLMVDSSIVILESIFKHIEAGKPKIKAAVDGAGELSSAVIASTITTLVVFLPLIFVEGIASELFMPLALTVSFALVASLLTALTLVPMLASKFIKEEAMLKEDSRFTRFGKFVNHHYRRLLRWALNHRFIVILITVATMVGSLLLVPFIGAEFLPSADEGEIMITVETPAASTLEETQVSVERIWSLLEPYEEAIQSTYSTVGGGGMFGGSNSSNTATVNISLISPGERSITTEEMVDELAEQVKRVPGADITVATMTSAAMGEASPITIGISGPEVEVLEQLADEVMFLVERLPGTRNVESTSGEGTPQINVHVDRLQAAQYGLTYQDVMSQIMVAFRGEVATEYRENGQEVDVEVTLPEYAREQLSDFRNLSLTTPTGSTIPLIAVAELEEGTSPTEINRQDQQRRINITADVSSDRTLGEVYQEVQQELSQLNLPDGYTLNFGGEAEDMQEAFGDLTLALIAAIFLIYAVMAIQFESFFQPFIIMFSLPATLIGVLVGLFVTQTPLSVTAFIGIILLAGIVINNAIIMVDYINQQRRNGMDRDEAIQEAGPARLRPIMMTVLTTILAMIPIALGIGEGAEAQAPMGVVVIFGLAFSTLFTLVLIPVVYSLTDGFLTKVKGWFTRKSTAEPLE